jgi:hypothetical protein
MVQRLFNNSHNGVFMTPDQFISTLHRARTDQMAMRLALTDLAQCLAPSLRDQWLQALQARIAKSRKMTQTMTPDQRAGMLEIVMALETLHRALSEDQPRSKMDD